MKTTIDLPEDLLRRANAEAAHRGRNLNQLVEEGLTRVLGKEPRLDESVLREVLLSVAGISESGHND